MNIHDAYLNELKKRDSHAYDLSLNKKIISLIDLTLLDPTASDEALANLSRNANLHQVAAICVLPIHLNDVKLQKSIKRATVINFPQGNESSNRLLFLLDKITKDSKTEEIDYVFPYQAYLAGNEPFALKQCEQIYRFCQNHQLLLKVILETGALPSLEAIYRLSYEVLNSGCDFLKTSTGKIAQGATLPAAFAMLQAMSDSNLSVGIKISGGIKTPAQAYQFIWLAQQMQRKQVDKNWFRIGASSLLDALIAPDNSQPNESTIPDISIKGC